MRFTTIITKISFLIFALILKFINLFIIKRQKAIIVFFAGKLGDLVCLTSVFKNIKASQPNLKLILIAKYPFTKIIEGNPFIDQIITFKRINNLNWVLNVWVELSKFKIKYFFNFVPTFESGVLGFSLNSKNKFFITHQYNNLSEKIISFFYHKIEYKFDKHIKHYYLEILQELGFKMEETKNKIFLNKKQTVDLFNFYPELKNNGGKNIGISISSGKSFKRWPAKHWLALIRKINQNFLANFIFFGTEDELEEINSVKNELDFKTYVVSGVDLEIIPNILENLNLFVAVDTGLLYVADALNVPVVDIVGPCDTKTQSPENRFILVKNEVKCQPLSKVFLTPPKEYYGEIKECFASISVDQVFKACILFLK